MYQQPGKTEDTVREQLEARGITYPDNGDVESALTVRSDRTPTPEVQGRAGVDDLSGNVRSGAD